MGSACGPQAGASSIGDVDLLERMGIEVLAVATPLRLGGSVASYEVIITDGAGDRVCTARLSCLLKK